MKKSGTGSEQFEMCQTEQRTGPEVRVERAVNGAVPEFAAGLARRLVALARPMLALTHLSNYLTLKGSFPAGWLAGW